LFHMAQKTCEPSTWTKNETVNCEKGAPGFQKAVCYYTRDKFCHTTKSCKAFGPCRLQ
jgi:hypothetical protein